MFLTRRSYDAALADAYARGLAAGERTIAVLQEQLRAQARATEAASARAESRADDMARIAAAAAFTPSASPPGPTKSTPPVESRLRSRLEGMDPFAEVPIGDPIGTYTSPAEADLLPGLSDALARELNGEARGDQ